MYGADLFSACAASPQVRLVREMNPVHRKRRRESKVFDAEFGE